MRKNRNMEKTLRTTGLLGAKARLRKSGGGHSIHPSKCAREVERVGVAHEVRHLANA